MWDWVPQIKQGFYQTRSCSAGERKRVGASHSSGGEKPPNSSNPASLDSQSHSARTLPPLFMPIIARWPMVLGWSANSWTREEWAWSLIYLTSPLRSCLTLPVLLSVLCGPAGPDQPGMIMIRFQARTSAMRAFKHSGAMLPQRGWWDRQSRGGINMAPDLAGSNRHCVGFITVPLHRSEDHRDQRVGSAVFLSTVWVLREAMSRVSPSRVALSVINICFWKRNINGFLWGGWGHCPLWPG